MHTSCFSCLDGHPRSYSEDGRWCFERPSSLSLSAIQSRRIHETINDPKHMSKVAIVD